MRFSNRINLRLEEVCTKITDGSHFSPKESKHGYPMLSVKDMTDYGFDYSSCKLISEEDYQIMVRNDCVPKKNDILIAKDGSYLKHIFITREEREEAILSSIAIFRPNTDIVYPKYLCYILKNPIMKQIIKNNYVSGSALPRIVLKNFKKVQIEIIPLTEQKAIADILSSLDDKIENNNKINENLQSISQLLFKHWFVDFEFPNEEGLPYKSSGGEMIDSELGMIPKGWKVSKISSIAEVVGGGTPSTKNEEYYADNGIAWITPKDLSGYSFKFISRGNRDITKTGLKNSSAKLMPKGTVLFSSRAPIGYIAVAKNQVCTNQGFKSLVPKDDTGTEFIYNMVIFYKEKIEGLANGSTFKEVSGQTMKNFKVVIPTKQMLYRFEELSKSLSDKILNNEEEIITLTKLRDTLLPKLMNGEIDLSNFEINQ